MREREQQLVAVVHGGRGRVAIHVTGEEEYRLAVLMRQNARVEGVDSCEQLLHSEEQCVLVLAVERLHQRQTRLEARVQRRERLGAPRVQPVVVPTQL